MINKKDSERLERRFPGQNWEIPFWSFTCHSRQNYAETVPLDAEDEIILGIRYPKGGCLAELCFRWHNLNGRPSLLLEVFDDAWCLLQTHTFQLVMNQLVQCENPVPTPEELSAMLISWGIVDQSDNPLPEQAGNPMFVPAVMDGAEAD